jgi:hypothetical protein
VSLPNCNSVRHPARSPAPGGRAGLGCWPWARRGG